VSSDTSPSSGRLDAPARTVGGAGGAVTRRQLPVTDPPWLKVIGTTLRLWLRRRVLRVPDSGTVSKLRRAGLTATVIVAAAVAVGATVLLAGSQPGHAARQPRQHAPAKPVVTPAQAAATANGQAAAAWIEAQVSQQVMVDCDPAMCADLQAAGYPAGQLVVLQPGGNLPAGGATATLIADTALLRSYSARLDAAAPAVIASFGAGPETVQLRLVMAGGATGYQRSASKALAARRAAGRALVLAGQLHMQATAKQDLRAGLIDPRLILVLGRLARRDSVYVVRFSDAGPLADPSLPFRAAEIDGFVTRQGNRKVTELPQVLKLLEAQPAPYRPELTVTHQAGRTVVTIQFPAPSPF